MSHRDVNKLLPQADNKDSKAAQPSVTEFKPAATLNVIFLGTGYHHSKPDCKSMLTELFECLDESPTQSNLLADGPGASPAKEAKNEFMLGTYTPKVDYDPTTGRIQVTKTPKEGGASKPGGRLWGAGCEDAVTEAIMAAGKMISAGKKPILINAFGFSRGAALNTLNLANRLQAIYGKDMITMNVFAIDPVAGWGLKHILNAKIIPEIIREYFSILMMDENRPFFEPQDKSRLLVQSPTKTKLKFRLYGGTHASATRIETLDLKENFIAAGSAFMGLDDLMQFVQRTGIILQKPLRLLQIADMKTFKWTYHPARTFTSEERLTNYTRLKMLMSGKKAGKREFVSRKRDYMLHGPDYFLCPEHQKLFAEVYKAYFDYLFQRNIRKSKPSDVRENLKKILADEDLAKTLQDAGLLLSADFLNPDKSLPPPTGVPLLAEEFSEDRPVVTSAFTQLLYSVNTAINNAYHAGSQSEVITQLLMAEDASLQNQEQKGEAFRYQCQASVKVAVFNALQQLEEKKDESMLRFQLNEIIQDKPEVFVFLHLFKGIIEKNEMINILSFLESILNDDKLTPEIKKEQIIQMIDSLSKNINPKLNPVIQEKMKDAFLTYKKILDKPFKFIFLEVFKKIYKNPDANDVITDALTYIDTIQNTPLPMHQKIQAITHHCTGMVNSLTEKQNKPINKELLFCFKTFIEKISNSTPAHFVIKSLQKFSKEAIALQIISELQSTHINNPTFVKHLIDLALNAVVLDRQAKNVTKESKLELALRNIQAALVTIQESTLNPGEEERLKVFCEKKLKHDVNQLKNVVQLDIGEFIEEEQLHTGKSESPVHGKKVEIELRPLGKSSR